MSSSLYGPGRRFWRSSFVFHGAFRMPATRLAVFVGKYAQKWPGSVNRSSGAAHQIGTSSPSSSERRSTPASSDSRWTVLNNFQRRVAPPSASLNSPSTFSSSSVRFDVDPSSRRSCLTCSTNSRNSGGNSRTCRRRLAPAPGLSGSRTTFVAQSMSSCRTESVSRASRGSTGSATRSTGQRSTSGATSPMRSHARRRSKRNEPARLKNSGASVTPRTDLKPRPNLPISLVPRLGDRWENITRCGV